MTVGVDKQIAALAAAMAKANGGNSPKICSILEPVRERTERNS